MSLTSGLRDNGVGAEVLLLLQQLALINHNQDSKAANFFFKYRSLFYCLDNFHEPTP